MNHALEHRHIRRSLAGILLTLGVLALNKTSLAVGGAAWVKFEDPQERAFSFDVPHGWVARGGMFRVGYSDYRPMVDVKSAGGVTDVRFGDVAVPAAYAQPTPQHPNDGDVDDLGAQAQLIYATYRGGKDYARLYALTRFKTLCLKLTPQAANWTPPTPAGTSPAQHSDGTVMYRCDSGGRSRIAYVYALTAQEPQGLWKVASLISFIAPAGGVARAHAIITRAARTLHFRSSWIAYQKNMDDEGLRYQIARQRNRLVDLGKQVEEFQAKMRGMQDQVGAFERGQAAQAGQVEAFGNALTGITPTVDPLNGQTRDVWTGPNNGYWQNGVGTIVNSNTSPGAGFHQLQPH